MGIYGFVWVCKGMYHHVGVYIGIYGYVWIYMVFCISIFWNMLVFLGIYSYIRVCIDCNDLRDVQRNWNADQAR